MVSVQIKDVPERTHAVLRQRWELRDSLAVYDAAYVALAEVIQATLLTGDRRLTGASGHRCRIEVLQSSG